MKKIIFLAVFVFVLISCKKEEEKITSFKKYDESEALAEQKKHQNKRMQFALFQSKVLDLNKVFEPLEKDLAKFTEEEYQSLKPLIVEQNIPSIQKNIAEGKLNYEKLTLFYLHRIKKIESDSTLSLNAIISLNPNVIKEAREKDLQKNKASEFSVYGMPILLKDNINTEGMPTTAGAIALANNKNTKDAFIVAKLKEEGALILGKVNLSEWAYFFCDGCPLGYSAIGGQTLNPYGRGNFETGGSSSGSGVAVAANFAVAAIGTETSGSITSPSSQNSVVGLKPTIGVLSISGIVPISSTLDTPGPMTKNVIDNAILMNAMRGFDQQDKACQKLEEDYFQNGFQRELDGLKLGVLNTLLQDSLYASTVDKLRKVGVEVIEITPPEISFENFITLLNMDMKYDLPKYLSKYADTSIKFKSIDDIVAFNKADSILRAPYGQQLFEGIMADKTTLHELRNIKKQLEAEGKKFLEAIEIENLDAILSINNYNSGHAALAKYPTLTVPMGYKKSGEPVNLTLIGKPFSERKLLEIGYAFEQMTEVRKMPLGYE